MLLHMSEIAKALGTRLRELREASGTSQEELADRAGLHRTHISLIERGQRSVRIETLDRLATALRVPLWELLRGIKEGRRR
jgi:transcriptional regulator with XRE-family HTH domain